MRKSTKNKNKVILSLLWLGIIAYTFLFAFLKILQYKSFFSFSWIDLAIYNQIAFNTAKGIPFYCSIRNTVFHYHLSLIYIIIGFLYKIYPHIYTLFFSLSFALGSGALGIYLIAKRVFLNRWIGLCFAYCYLLFLPLHFINFIDFRPMMYSIPFLIFTYYFYVTKRFRYFVLFSVLTIICKENLGFIIAMFGLLSLFKQRKLRWVLFPFFFGILWFVFSVKIVLPFLGYKRYEPLWKYLGGQKYNFYPVFQKFFNNPLEIFQTMTGYGHIQYLLKIFNPYIYLLAFLSPGILFLSLPTFMEIMLQSEWSQLHFQAGHYICGIIVFAFIAIIYTYKKIFLIINKMNISLKKKNNIIKILIFILLTWTLVSNFGDTMIVGSNAKRASAVDPRFLNVKNMFNPVFYLQDYEDKIAWEFIEKIPPDSSVAASSDLLPALSSRKELYEFGLYKFADKDYLYYLPPKWGTSPEYIILRKHSINHGYTKSDIKNKDLVNEAERLVRQEQYKKVKETELFLLLKKIN